MIGSTLGHYEILELLGEGGMGEVYRARDTKLGREVALKLLPVAMSADAERRQRFEREARAVAALKHPNIVTIHSVEEDQGRLFLTMELVEGRTLADLIPSGGMSLDKFFGVALPLAEAVTGAHQKSITHRDLKPANVMVGAGGQLKVLDFGLAKLLEAEPSNLETMAENATAQGHILGTAAYMSPEQAEGKPVDPRSDIFSMGVMLYEMATGNRPFKGDTNISTITSILRDDPPSVTDLRQNLPRHLGRIVRRCLAKDPDRRYQTAQDLRNDLLELKEEIATGDLGAPVTAGRGATGARSRRPLVFGAVAVGVLAVAAVVVFKVLPRASAPPATPTPAGQAMHMNRLTTTGKSIEAAISPDGKMVAHVKLENGITSLWITQVSTQSTVEIAPGSDAGIWDPTFDRSGEYVYFIRQEKGSDTPTLQRVPVLGGGARKVLDNVAQTISFSPDGSRFAYVSGEPGTTKSMIKVVNADGSGERVLAMKEGVENFSENPTWSPDGKLIAAPVQSFRSGIECYVVGYPAEGGEERRLSPRTWLGLAEITWLPDGSGLVVAASEAFGGSQLWEVGFPGGAARRITNDVNDYNGVSLTADGKILAVGLDENNFTLQVVGADGSGEPTAVTTGKDRSDGTAGICWTSDGRILYGSTSGGELAVWRANADGTGAMRLTQLPSADPQVSPDGHSLALTVLQQGIHVWRYDADGGNPVQLTKGDVESGARWSLDGQWLVYQGGLSQQLYKIPAAGGEPVLLSPTPSVNNAIVSPDGKLIAFRAYDPARKKGQTFIIPFAGGEPVKILDIPSGTHQWSPDGRAITYSDDKEGVTNLWSQPLDGGPPRPITRFTQNQIVGFAWSRDGKRIALSRGQSSSDVVLITDFR